MTDHDFTTTVLVDRTPAEAFAAINNVRGWWSEDIEGSTDELGAEFTFRANDLHRSRIRVTELVPGERVVWLVLDNYMSFVEDQTEWKGTRIAFEISPRGEGAEIRFSHLGLVPEHECFDVCSTAWSFYINGSLPSLITTGEGQPILKEVATRIAGSVALVTGANRGIGLAITDALLERGAKKVYATARDPRTLAALTQQHGSRVVALRLDVTRADEVAEIARQATDVDLLFNNAGVAEAGELTGEAIVDQARREMEVNYFGALRMVERFADILSQRGGAIVNVGSAAGLANVPLLPTYSASKAALHSLTQASRALLAARGVTVFGVYAGPVDTDMTRGLALDKSSPHDVAAAVLDGIEAGDDDIFPDPFAVAFGEQFESSPKGSERQMAALVAS